MINKIEKVLIESAIKIVKENLGCLFIIMIDKFKYCTMIDNSDINSFDVFKECRRLEALGRIDGAVIINISGMTVAYSAQVLNTKPFKNYHTRHSAAHTATLNNNNIAVLGSQEDKKIRVFKKGKIVIQLDVLEPNIESKTKYAVNILENIGVGGIATAATSVISPGFYNTIFNLPPTTPVGLAIIPGVLVFGSLGYLAKMFLNFKNKR